MWQALMDAQVKIEDKPEIANIQLKACVRVSVPAATMKQRSPIALARMIAKRGRPALSMYPRILGA
jgi:hypothetical protein